MQHTQPYRRDDFFRNFLPQDVESRAKLKGEIATDGRCRDPLVLADIAGEVGLILIDGNTRDDLVAELRKAKVKVETPKTVTMKFANRGEALVWLIRNSKTRRQLGPEDYARAVLLNEAMVLELRQTAKANQKAGKRKVGARRAQGRVDEILANIADVSVSTIKRVRKVLESKDETVIARLFEPDRNQRISIAEAAREVRSAVRTRQVTERAQQARLRREPFQVVDDDGHGYENRIIEGDNLDVLKTRVPDGVATMIICSPPYPIPHLRVGYDVYKYEGYAKWLADFTTRCAEFYRVSRSGGRFALNLDLTSDRQIGQTTKYPALIDACVAARSVGWQMLDGFSWYKQKASGDRPNWGSYCSPTLPNIRRVDEPVVIFYKENPRLEGDDDLADMLPADFEHATISTWNYSATTRLAAETLLDSFWYVPTVRSEAGGHPCPYPEKLVDLLLLNWTRRGDLIIDPYNGSGTSTAVAQRRGRRFLGIDLSRDYCAQARARLL